MTVRKLCECDMSVALSCASDDPEGSAQCHHTPACIENSAGIRTGCYTLLIGHMPAEFSIHSLSALDFIHSMNAKGHTGEATPARPLPLPDPRPRPCMHYTRKGTPNRFILRKKQIFQAYRFFKFPIQTVPFRVPTIRGVGLARPEGSFHTF